MFKLLLLFIVSVILIQLFLANISAADDRHADRQCFLTFVELSVSLSFINFVFQVDVQIVNIRVLEKQSVVVDVECSLLHAVYEFHINCYCDLCWQFVRLF